MFAKVEISGEIEVFKKENVEYPRKYQDYTVCVHEETIPDSVEVKRMI